jgi:plastocyanin
MRKLLLFLLAVASLAAAGAAADSAKTAATATQAVTISKTGYKPTSVSINTGDSVKFSNSDTVAHTVSFNATTGMSCGGAIPFAVQPGSSTSCTFSSAGRFRFSDPANKGKNFRGTVTVAVALTSSLAVTPKAVVYGHKTALAGVVASKQAGVSLQVLAQACGASTSSPVTTVTTTTGGAFTYQAQPLNKTAYSVKSKNQTSSAATVNVMPQMRLKKIGRHRYSVRISAAQTFAGKYASFQRYRSATKRWRAVKRVLLKANTSGVAPTLVTSAAFRSSIRAKQRVRVVLGQKQVGACYIAGRSNTIRS